MPAGFAHMPIIRDLNYEVMSKRAGRTHDGTLLVPLRPDDCLKGSGAKTGSDAKLS